MHRNGQYYGSRKEKKRAWCKHQSRKKCIVFVLCYYYALFAAKLQLENVFIFYSKEFDSILSELTHILLWLETYYFLRCKLYTPIHQQLTPCVDLQNYRLLYLNIDTPVRRLLVM